MASIFKRGSVWWIHYYVGGKAVSRSLRTAEHRGALEKKQRLEAFEITDQLAAPSNTPTRRCVQDFCEYLNRTQMRKGYKNDVSYLRGFFGCCCPALQMGSHVPHKFRNNQRRLPMIKDQHLDRHVPVTRLEQVSSEMVASHIRQRMVKDHISPKTANRIREVLHRFFNYAAAHHGYVPGPPMSQPRGTGQAYSGVSSIRRSNGSAVLGLSRRLCDVYRERALRPRRA